MRGVIGVFDVKPKADHFGVGLCLAAGCVDRARETRRSHDRAGRHRRSGATRASRCASRPFPGDRGLADDCAGLADLGDPVAQPIGIGQGLRDTPASRTAGSRTLPSVSSARRRLNSTIVGRSASAASRIQTVGSGSLKGGRSGGCGRDGSLLEGPEALLRSGQSGLRGRSWRALHRAWRRAALRE